ncbi:xaa-Pro dipeptidase-like [Schistocerca gregaria]|uniref:xaa-Pro dipeptidase-like n=1 Tax=Schistocerca gregaria TaxID=7010 RepID=UPI00211EA5A2|nr:xaa-Pro dipeptidase-like [Schistocerca gregaria]XP_049849675.1 xaa-Pro dipeptidase-like [Schistocerca gregaria]
MMNDERGPEFWMGENTFHVPMAMHKEQQQRLLSRLRKLSEIDLNGVVLLQGGRSQDWLRYDTDHERLFRQESFFHYLFGVKEPDFYGSLSISTGKYILYVPRLPRSYQVWMGRILSTDEYRSMYGADEVRYTEELPDALTHETGGVGALYVLSGTNSDSGSRCMSADFKGIERFLLNKDVLYHELCECRVVKTELELELLRYVNRISSEAHMHVMKSVRPDMMEYQIEANFCHYAYYYGGCRNTSYTCICASGENGSVLHYGHAAAPNSRQIRSGDMVLLDMGAEYHCYASDITRSYPVTGKFTEQQRGVYEVVRRAQMEVISRLKPGVFWPDMHRFAERCLCEGMKKLGLVRGDVEEMMKNHVGSLFMPHGLGHLMGIDTHDVGGFLGDVCERSEEPGLRHLRCWRKLEAGMVITVEPGIYFNWAELEEAMLDPSLKPFLAEEELVKYRYFGGVRIEDDVVVTPDGCEVLTVVPSDVEEIQRIMLQGKDVISS